MHMLLEKWKYYSLKWYDMEIIEFISNLRWYTEYYVHFSYYYAISEISDYYYLYKRSYGFTEFNVYEPKNE